jgi:hypothetical protein
MTPRRIQQALAAGALAVGLLMLPVARAEWPPPPPADPASLTGCVARVVQFTAFIPPAVQQAMADRGLPITPTAIPFKELRAKAWACNWADGGSDFYVPRFVRQAEYFRHDLTQTVAGSCAGQGLCDGGAGGWARLDDGGMDPFDDVPFRCACAMDNTCLVGGQPATQGVTLAPGTFSGTGCRRKACGTLWLDRSLPDGGVSHDPSWPPVCPAP